MAIFRCNGCSHLREVSNDYLGKRVRCPKCKELANVHETRTFVATLIDKYVAQQEELTRLRNNEQAPNSASTPQSSDIPVFDDVDINNTNILTLESNLAPISDWFKKRQISVDFDPDATDTTGFFDEIALRLGDDFERLSGVTKQIKYIQNKGYKNVKLDLSKYSSKDQAKIKAFCKELYEYSFVTRNYYKKADQSVHLTVQTAPKIRDFFNGTWMEWFVLIKLLQFLNDNKIAAACVRSATVTFQSGGSNELDVFALTNNGTPLCIECKTGEFRKDIDKYLALRKQLGISKDQFVLCIFGLSSEQAVGLTSMYDITFVNEHSLMEHVENALK